MPADPRARVTGAPGRRGAFLYFVNTSRNKERNGDKIHD
ncbi:hypothetical protein GDI3221 [Gluconacetobacter diazotrophicus PA1 5]|uniref:Uncharacterized protein n=1 Tax=Gluconacetobacter diazotrophicus (strain ATCC 49037 / DSM 5601 / CCUG 37298 / CIP 103539 / LMG 7603 / PAl5) TaxID=272568 RepID=A9H0R8_GLUDA|nr:hypothetical protein GDI3221 [Gluconacetobacter diazotrophicus PA1 5]